MCRERLLSHIFGLTTTSKSFNPVPGRSERPESSVGRSLLGDIQGRWVLWWPQGPVSNSDTNLGNVTSALPSGDIPMQLLPGDFPQQQQPSPCCRLCLSLVAPPGWCPCPPLGTSHCPTPPGHSSGGFGANTSSLKFLTLGFGLVFFIPSTSKIQAHFSPREGEA